MRINKFIVSLDCLLFFKDYHVFFLKKYLKHSLSDFLSVAPLWTPDSSKINKLPCGASISINLYLYYF